jgi:hypothetical protein
MIEAGRFYRTCIDLPSLSGMVIPCGTLVVACYHPYENGLKMTDCWDCEVLEYQTPTGGKYIVRTQEKHLRREPC